MSTEEILRTEFSNSSTEDLRSSADSSSDNEATDSSNEAIAPVTPAVGKPIPFSLNLEIVTILSFSEEGVSSESKGD